MFVFQCATIEDARAEFRLQRQKLRRLATVLLKEFRGRARAPSMVAHSKTVFISIYRFFNIILTIHIHVYNIQYIYSRQQTAGCDSMKYYRVQSVVHGSRKCPK